MTQTSLLPTLDFKHMIDWAVWIVEFSKKIEVCITTSILKIIKKNLKGSRDLNDKKL